MQMFVELPNQQQNHHHHQQQQQHQQSPEEEASERPSSDMLEMTQEENAASNAINDSLVVAHDDDLEADGDSLAQICRLCLKLDDLMISIYDRLDPNPNKRPLHERIEDMFHVKVSDYVFFLQIKFILNYHK